MPNHPEASSATTRPSPANDASFATLARRITGWTTNLLAIAVALAVSLALGWQLMGWLREKPPGTPAIDATAAANLPPIEHEREFWTSGGLVKIQRQSGTPDDMLEALRSFCREKSTTSQPRTIGPGEAAFVKQLLACEPLEESAPLALYQPPGQASMVVAVDRDRKQIVAWSFAAPAPGGGWSLYHFRPK